MFPTYWSRSCPLWYFNNSAYRACPGFLHRMIHYSSPKCSRSCRLTWRVTRNNRPTFIITALSAVAEKRYSSPIGIFLFRRRGSASGSDLGRSTPGQSPYEPRFFLSHFLPRRTRSNPTGRARPRTSCCGDARFANGIPLLATVAGASRRTMNSMTGLGSDADFALVAARPSPCFPCFLCLTPTTVC